MERTNYRFSPTQSNYPDIFEHIHLMSGKYWACDCQGASVTYFLHFFKRYNYSLPNFVTCNYTGTSDDRIDLIDFEYRPKFFPSNWSNIILRLHASGSRLFASVGYGATLTTPQIVEISGNIIEASRLFLECLTREEVLSLDNI